jgi:hypothetical protein
MRKAILALVMVATAAAAQPADAVDDGFRGRYRLLARAHLCPGRDDYRHPAKVRYISEGVRELVHAGRFWSGRFRYVRGRRFPWRRDDGGFVLRYRPGTDSAVGIRHEDCWRRVRLVPIG